MRRLEGREPAPGEEKFSPATGSIQVPGATHYPPSTPPTLASIIQLFMPTSASHQLQGFTLLVPTNGGNLHFGMQRRKRRNITWASSMRQLLYKEVLCHHCNPPSRLRLLIPHPCPHSTDGEMDAQRREFCSRSHIHNQQTWTWTQVFKATIFIFQNTANLIPAPSSNSPEQPCHGLFGVLQFGSMKETTDW